MQELRTINVDIPEGFAEELVGTFVDAVELNTEKISVWSKSLEHLTIDEQELVSIALVTSMIGNLASQTTESLRDLQMACAFKMGETHCTVEFDDDEEDYGDEDDPLAPDDPDDDPSQWDIFNSPGRFIPPLRNNKC